MELLNAHGQIILDYRRAFRECERSDKCQEALKQEVYNLYKNGKIPEKLFRDLLDLSKDDADIYAYMVSRREFSKSSVELNSEFDIVRQRINDYLITIGFTRNVVTKNYIHSNRIYVIKQYDVPKSFLLSFFGVAPIEFAPLMRRKGFMDKFCVLRLSQVFAEIYASLDVPDHIDHGYGKIYYNKSIQGFSIDYNYKLNINYVKDVARMEDILQKIQVIDAGVEQQFEQKMNGYSIDSMYKEMSPAELQAEIAKIGKIPVRNGRKFMDIRKPELIVEETMQKESPKNNVEKKPTIVLSEEDLSPKEPASKDTEEKTVGKPEPKPSNTDGADISNVPSVKSEKKEPAETAKKDVQSSPEQPAPKPNTSTTVAAPQNNAGKRDNLEDYRRNKHKQKNGQQRQEQQPRHNPQQQKPVSADTNKPTQATHANANQGHQPKPEQVAIPEKAPVTTVPERKLPDLTNKPRTPAETNPVDQNSGKNEPAVVPAQPKQKPSSDDDDILSGIVLPTNKPTPKPSNPEGFSVSDEDRDLIFD